MQMFKFGDEVTSKSVGWLPEFAGVVTHRFTDDRGEFCYHVKDVQGVYHSRTAGDLTFTGGATL